MGAREARARWPFAGYWQSAGGTIAKRFARGALVGPALGTRVAGAHAVCVRRLHDACICVRDELARRSRGARVALTECFGGDC